MAGTSRIEGAEFTEKELDAAMRETPRATRDPVAAAGGGGAWPRIAGSPACPPDRPVDEALIREVHRRIVTGCDDDHCAPGQLRGRDENVTFGAPRHRGAEGGEESAEAFRQLAEAARTVFREARPAHPGAGAPLPSAAMHPFLDGNGRTARALEALMLQRTGLRDTLFIAMSNYYYENKTAYLNGAERRARRAATT